MLLLAGIRQQLCTDRAYYAFVGECRRRSAAAGASTAGETGTGKTTLVQRLADQVITHTGLLLPAGPLLWACCISLPSSGSDVSVSYGT